MTRSILQYDNESFPLDRAYYSLGRGDDCHFTFQNSTLSRRHALLVKDEDTYVLFDLKSANGVRVDGKPIDIHILQDGEVIHLGELELRYSRVADVEVDSLLGRLASLETDPDLPLPQSALSGTPVAGRELAIILDAVTELFASSTPRELYTRCLQLVLDKLEMEDVYLLRTAAQSGQHMIVAAWKGGGAQIPATGLSLPGPLQTLLDDAESKQKTRILEAGPGSTSELKYGAAVPVVAGDRVLGFLVAATRGLTAPSLLERAVLTSFGRALGRALERIWGSPED